MIGYNPSDWYWLASDGRLFASARQVTITATDTAYLAWVAAGGVATPWPKDEAGDQTTAALQWVFDNAGVVLTVDQTKQLTAYAASKQIALLAAGGTVNVAASGATAINVLCDGTSNTRADLALLALWGQQNATGTKTWIDNNGVATTLTATQLVTLATSIGNWIDSTYATLATALAGIAASPATITTTAEIDTVFAADKTS